MTIGSSESGKLAVCQEHEIQGDVIAAKWSQQEVAHWWWYNPLQEAPDLFLSLPLFMKPLISQRQPSPSATSAVFLEERGFSSQPSAQITTQRESPLSAFQGDTAQAWSILKVYEAALNRDEEMPQDRGQGLDGILEREDDGASGANVEQHVADPLIQVAFMVSKAAQERCYMIPSFTEEIDRWRPSPPAFGVLGYSTIYLAPLTYVEWWLASSGGDVTCCEHCRRIMSLARPYPNGRKRRRDKRFCSDPGAARRKHRSRSRA